MKRKILDKYLKYYSICFIAAICSELILFIVFSLNIELNLGTYTLSIVELIFTSGFLSFHGIIEWILLLVCICGFLILGISLLIISLKKNLEDGLLAKFIFFNGMFFLITGFIKFFSIYLLANNLIQYDSTSIIFQEALYTIPITPLIGALMWIYFSSVTIGILISGLVFSGFGLKAIQKTELGTK